MQSEKSILSLLVWIVFIVSIFKTSLNVYQELQRNSDGATVLAILVIPKGNDGSGRTTTLFIKDTTFKVAFRSLVKSVLYTLATEILRSLIVYMMFESRSMHITMTHNGSRDQDFSSLYWKMIIDNSVDRVTFSYVYEPEVYEIRSKWAFYVTMATYDTKTGQLQTRIRPRVFGWC